MLWIQKNILFFCILLVSCTIPAYAKKSQVLWTPADVAMLPFVYTKDISSDGKYTIMQLIETFQKGSKKDRHARCILVNNDNLNCSPKSRTLSSQI